MREPPPAGARRRCARVGECVGIGQTEVSGAGMRCTRLNKR